MSFGLSQVWAAFALALFLVACDGPEEREAAYLERGRARFEEGNYVKAGLEFKNALQINPAGLEAVYYQGLIAEKQANWVKALVRFRQVTQQQPDHVGANLGLGKYFFLAGFLDRALEKADAVSRIEPENAAAHALRGAIYLRRNRLSEAKSEAEAALSVDPANTQAAIVLATAYSQEEKQAEAIKALDDGIRLNPGNTPLHLLKIEIHLGQKKIEQVEAIYHELFGLEPENGGYRVRLAKLYIALNRLDDAEQLLRDAIATLGDEGRVILIEFLASRRSFSVAERELRGFIEQAPDNHVLRFRFADLYTEHDLSDRAEAVFLEIIDRDGTGPQGLAAHMALARLRVASGDTAAAEDLIATVLQEEPSNGEALILHARLSLHKGETANAIAALRTVLRDDPTSKRGLSLLAEAHIRAGDLELASETLRTLISVDPFNDAVRVQLANLLMRKGNFETASSLLDEALDIAPGSLAGLRSKTLALIALEDLAEAATMARRIIEETDTPALGHQLLGRVHLAAGRYADAVASFSQALILDPGRPEHLSGLVQSYVAQNKTGQAIQYLEDLIARAPGEPFAHNLLGEAHLLQGQTNLAEQAFLQAASLRQEWNLPYLNLAKARIATGDPRGAVEAFREGLLHSPDDKRLMFGLATAYQFAGDYAALADTYEALLERDPQLDAVANNFASVIAEYQFQDPKRLERALQVVERFQTSENPVYLDTLGWVHYRMGNINQALIFLGRAVQIKPDVPEHHYHLGMALYENGELSRARQELEKSVIAGARYPGIDQARELLASLPADE